jgi:hypothetical protein
MINETFQEGSVNKEKASNGGMKNNSTTAKLTENRGQRKGMWESIRHQRKSRWDASTKCGRTKQKSQTSTPFLPIHQGTVPSHALPRDS